MPIRRAPSHLKLILGAVSAVLVLLAVPSVAAAAEFVVNTTVDTETIGETPCVESHQCTLRDALGLANGNGVPDTISFAGIPAGSVIEVDEAPLPTIFEALTIDGDTAAGATPGVPAVGLVPINFASLEFVPGLNIHAGEGTRIEGLAIGGFGSGIELGPTEGAVPSGTEICGNYLGTELNGGTANPNGIGIEIGGNPGERPQFTTIGNGSSCAGNVISGNSHYGVSDSGFKTTIAGDDIGIGAPGASLPNGAAGEEAAGVFETETASGTMIGGVAPSRAEGNLIWFNHGPGVLVDGPTGKVSIRHDSFFENEGKAIEIIAGTQPAPTISATSSPFPGTLVIEGTVTAEDAEEVELEFFAGTTCAARDARTFLGGSGSIPVLAGANQFRVELSVTVEADESAISATSSPTGGGTTEFSNCATYERPKPSEPPPSSQSPPGAPTTKTITPTNGEKVVVKPEAGKVLIKLPGTKKFVRLEELKEIPVGAVIDATKGRVLLTSSDPDGTEQSAEFFGGVFRVKQRDGAGLVVLELLDTVACPATASIFHPGTFATASAARPARTSGKLWGSGHGNFRTEGNDGSATVRGTIWLVEDRCDGTTFFKTRRGVVSVRDFVAHKTLPLPAGKTYLAGSG